MLLIILIRAPQGAQFGPALGHGFGQKKMEPCVRLGAEGSAGARRGHSLVRPRTKLPFPNITWRERS